MTMILPLHGLIPSLGTYLKNKVTISHLKNLNCSSEIFNPGSSKTCVNLKRCSSSMWGKPFDGYKTDGPLWEEGNILVSPKYYLFG